jgi:uncharacterized protein YcfJ
MVNQVKIGQGLGKVLVISAMLGASVAALADPYYGGYGAPAGEVYAPVLSSRPVYQQVGVAVPRQQCYDQPVVYRDDGAVVGGTLLGGLAGGLIGHAFGHGSGNAWATGVGAVVGAGIGNNIASANSVQTAGYQRQCTTVSDYQVQPQLVGYDVTYGYGGQVYRTRLSYDPGPQLLLSVNATPAGY